MVDTQYKKIDPTKYIGLPTSSAVTSPAPLIRQSFENALRPPGLLAAGRRVLLSQHMGGSNAFFIVSTAPAGNPDYPKTDDTYEAAKTAHHVTPGNYLEARVIAVPSGACEEQDGIGSWVYAGSSGAATFGHKWNTGADEDDPADQTVGIIPSGEDDNAEWTGFGGLWSQLQFHHIPDMSPDAWPDGLQSAIVPHSEWCPLELDISHVGSARIVHAMVSERARRHVLEHDTTDTTSHDWPEWYPPQTEYPQTKAADGATYEEHRFGTHRSLIAARNQADRMGPMIYQWSAHSEDGRDLNDTQPDPITLTSTSYVWLHDATVTAWADDEPGFAIPGAYAQRFADCDALNGKAAVIPVRLRVWANYSGAGANTLSVKVQVSDRSHLVLDISQSVTLQEYTTTGWLESNRAGDDAHTNGMVMVKTTGDTAQIYYLSLEFGHMADT